MTVFLHTTCFNLKNKTWVWLDGFFIMAHSFWDIPVHKFDMHVPVT